MLHPPTHPVQHPLTHLLVYPLARPLAYPPLTHPFAASLLPQRKAMKHGVDPQLLQVSDFGAAEEVTKGHLGPLHIHRFRHLIHRLSALRHYTSRRTTSPSARRWKSSPKVNPKPTHCLPPAPAPAAAPPGSGRSLAATQPRSALTPPRHFAIASRPENKGVKILNKKGEKVY